MKYNIIILCLLGLSRALEDDPLTVFRSASVRFTLDFFRQTFDQESSQNSVLSPASIQTSLAMLYHVATGKAREELQLTFGLSNETVQAVLAVEQFINSANDNALKIVSKVYHENWKLNPNLGPILLEKYNVDVEATDFSRRKRLVKSANAWIEKVTNGMLKDVLKVNSIKKQDKLLLLNAIYMNATWRLPFPSRLTRPGVFHYENGDQPVDMMFNRLRYHYGELDDLRFVDLPYNGDLSMLLIMPHQGSLKSVIEQMNSEMYKRVLQSLNLEEIRLRIPKFTITKNIDAKTLLKRMGLDAIFRIGAFDVFTEKRCELADIRQTAKIDVTEAGTTAAAVTVSWVRADSAPPRIIEFTVDKPFMYIIRKQSSNDILFIGHFSHHG